MRPRTTNRTMNRITMCLTAFTLGVMAFAFGPWQPAEACSRILYETGNGTYITGRGLDWNDPTAQTALWVYPRGLARDGGAGNDPIKWTSKYGSVGISIYDAGICDGMNEKGLAGNTLYLVETDFGDPSKRGKPTISVGAWLPYFLDNYATVKEAVEAMKDDPITVIAPILPNGRPAVQHLSLSDATGDSAIFEYIGGKLVIHHSRDYKVMTNSPVYEQQLALNAYWDQIGGNNFLPGTISAADRFVRLSYNLKASPKYKDPKMAAASVFSQMRAIGVPLGMADPDHPNISMTLWRSVADQGDAVYYFESAIMPSVLWVDLKRIDFKEGSGARTIPINAETALAGDVSSNFTPAEPFKWLKAE